MSLRHPAWKELRRLLFPPPFANRCHRPDEAPLLRDARAELRFQKLGHAPPVLQILQSELRSVPDILQIAIDLCRRVRLVTVVFIRDIDWM
jgi:hypothetical protein